MNINQGANTEVYILSTVQNILHIKNKTFLNIRTDQNPRRVKLFSVFQNCILDLP